MLDCGALGMAIYITYNHMHKNTLVVAGPVNNIYTTLTLQVIRKLISLLATSNILCSGTRLLVTISITESHNATPAHVGHVFVHTHMVCVCVRVVLLSWASCN